MVRIPKASKEYFLAFLLLSLTLHLAVCRIPVNSSVTDVNENVIQVSLYTVAAPAIAGNASEYKELSQEETKKLSEIEPAADSAIAPKNIEKNEQLKTKQILTANNSGKDISTIIPTLDSNDYIQTVAPIYPQRAIEKNHEGTVLVKALINDQGNAKDVFVVDSSGHSLLDDSAIKAVSQWKFKPDMLGKAKEMWVQVPVKFVIR